MADTDSTTDEADEDVVSTEAAGPGADLAAESGKDEEAGTDAADEQARREGSYLRPGEQSAWERWELPAMESGHVVSRGGRQPTVEEDEVEVQPLSLEELESIREAARQEGFAEGREAGYREGHDKGLRDGAGEVQAQADALRDAVAALARPLAELDDDLEDALATAVVEIARRVIGAELAARPELVRGIVRQAVDALAEGRGGLRLHLHPEDLALLRESGDSGLEGCELLPDPALSRGGVRADRGPSSTDFTRESRFRAAVGAFVRAGYEPAGADDDDIPAQTAAADEPPAVDSPPEEPA